MPFIYNHNLREFTGNKHFPDEITTRSIYYFNENAEFKGDGVLSGVGNLLKTGVDLVKGNKDLIIEGAKAAGSTASAVSKIVDAVKEDQQIRDLELIRKLQDQNKTKKISSSTKEKIASLANPEQKGDGFAKF